MKQIAVTVYIPDSKQLFLDLSENKDAIENELSEELDWNELPDKKASRIKLVTTSKRSPRGTPTFLAMANRQIKCLV